MGIYTNGDIFGIKIYTFNDDDNSNTLFEKKYSQIMNNEQKKEAYLFYTHLNNKPNVFFKIYTGYKSTHSITKNKINEDNFNMWYPISSNIFLEKFGPEN
jgi:hypothetical protein